MFLGIGSAKDRNAVVGVGRYGTLRETKYCRIARVAAEFLLNLIAHDLITPQSDGSRVNLFAGNLFAGAKFTRGGVTLANKVKPA